MHLFEGWEVLGRSTGAKPTPMTRRRRALAFAVAFYKTEALAPAVNYELEAIKRQAYPLGKPFNELTLDQISELEPRGWSDLKRQNSRTFRARSLVDEVLHFRLGDPDPDLMASLDWDAMDAELLGRLRKANYRNLGQRSRFGWSGTIENLLPILSPLPVKASPDGTAGSPRLLTDLYGVCFKGYHPESVHLVHAFVRPPSSSVEDLRYAAVIDARAPLDVLRVQLERFRRSRGLSPFKAGRPKKAANTHGPGSNLHISWQSIETEYKFLIEKDAGRQPTDAEENRSLLRNREFSRRRTNFKRIAQAG